MTYIADETAGNVSRPATEWLWVERAVWTDRMLKALQGGVKGGKWHNLIDKVFAPGNLQRAYERVEVNRGSHGIDCVSLKDYERELEHNQQTLAEQLRNGSYKPFPVRRVHLKKPGSRDTRPIGIPCVRDRVAQRAVKHVVEPIYERIFHPSSFGFRPERGCKDAIAEVERLLDEGYTHIVDADIKSCFDMIPKDLIMQRIAEHIADGKVLALMENCLEQGVMEDLNYWEPETGTPQGAVLSPLFANIFLNAFDWYLHDHGIRFVRFADDFVLMCRSGKEAEQALKLAEGWMSRNGLILHPDKTGVVDMNLEQAEFSFLGFRYKRHTNRKGETRRLKLVSSKSLKKLRTSLKEITKRCNGNSLDVIIRKLNQTLRGWYNYFKDCYYTALIEIDQYVRRRLRRILRKRQKRKRGTGRCLQDHKRWPNAYFSDLGLFALVGAS